MSAFGTRYLKKVFVFIKGIFTYAVVFFDTSVDERMKLGVGILDTIKRFYLILIQIVLLIKEFVATKIGKV